MINNFHFIELLIIVGTFKNAVHDTFDGSRVFYKAKRKRLTKIR